MEMNRVYEMRAAKRLSCVICGKKGEGPGDVAVNLKLRSGQWLVGKFPKVKADEMGNPIWKVTLGTIEPVCFQCLHEAGEEI